MHGIDGILRKIEKRVISGVTQPAHLMKGRSDQAAYMALIGT